MADDRPADDQLALIVQLQADLADLRSTVLVRASRRPTGCIEQTILATAPPDTLLMQGQVLQRSAYPVLWKWVSDNNRIGAGLFTAGDGSLSFGMPDWRGLVVRGVAASGETVGALTGADSRALAVANLPSHKHNVSVADHDQHRHNFLTDQDGAHGGHFPTSTINVSNGTGTVFGLAAWNSAGSAVSTHNHGGTTDYQPISSHNVTESLVGSGTAVDMRQAGVGVNWLIWC